MTQPEPEYRTIPLTQGQVAIVDTADYDWLNQFKWYAWWNPNTKSFYAARHAPRNAALTGGRKTGPNIYMHRDIMKPPSGFHVDHIHHNTLDNRRSEMRLATRSESQHNKRMYSNNTSGFRGVCWWKTKSKWVADITLNGKCKRLGYFDTAEAASEAYERAAREMFGAFNHPGS